MDDSKLGFIKNRKQKLQVGILNLVQEFEKETGAAADGIKLIYQRDEQKAGKKTIGVFVAIDVFPGTGE